MMTATGPANSVVRPPGAALPAAAVDSSSSGLPHRIYYVPAGSGRSGNGTGVVGYPQGGVGSGPTAWPAAAVLEPPKNHERAPNYYDRSSASRGCDVCCDFLQALCCCFLIFS